MNPRIYPANADGPTSIRNNKGLQGKRNNSDLDAISSNGENYVPTSLTTLPQYQPPSSFQATSAQTWPQSLNKEPPDLPKNEVDIRNDIITTGKLAIRVITWNQEAKATPSAKELSEQLFPTNKYHIYAIGAQECENSFARSILNPYKTRWEAVMMSALGPTYKMVRSHSLQTSHLAVFVHKSLIHLISESTSVAIATGIGNTLGNKGGIGISFAIGNSRLCFVNSHLSAHQNNAGRRTFEFAKISYDLTEAICDLNGYTGHLGTVSVGNIGGDEVNHDVEEEEDTSTAANPLLSCFDHVFWFGDMNYRIQGTREIVDGLLDNDMHEILCNNDQLTMLMKFDKVYAGFSEGPLNFRPTYKFDDASDVYDTSKKRRIPSWTDRILYKDDPNSDTLQLLAYDSVPNVRTSDHRPVYANFLAQIDIESDDADARRSTRDPFVRSETFSEVCIIL